MSRVKKTRKDRLSKIVHFRLSEPEFALLQQIRRVRGFKGTHHSFGRWIALRFMEEQAKEENLASEMLDDGDVEVGVETPLLRALEEVKEEIRQALEDVPPTMGAILELVGGNKAAIEAMAEVVLHQLPLQPDDGDSNRVIQARYTALLNQYEKLRDKKTSEILGHISSGISSGIVDA